MLCRSKERVEVSTLSLYALMASLGTTFTIIIKVLLLGIFSVHTPGYKNDLNCSFNQFTWVVTHLVRGIKGSDLLGFYSTAVKNRIKRKNTARTTLNLP